ncbi:MAG: hypothetical protein AAB663_02225 [Patescibacteria group bacterium]
MVTKGAPKKSGAGRKPLSRSLRMYQRIAVGFVVVTLLLLVTVLYLSISRATIHVVPVAKNVDVTVPVTVVPNPVEDGQMTGVVAAQTFTKAQTFTLPSTGGTPVEQKAGGMVTLINKTNAAQPLVATTRLLSEEGVLFRIDATTTVPANGSVDVMAHADKAGLSGEVAATQFTIPGLPASSQKDIYAVSVDPMVGGVQYVHVLTEQDLNDAVTSLTDAITLEAKDALAVGVDRTVFPESAVQTEVLERKSDTQPGTEAGMFTASLTIRVAAVYYDPKLLTDYLQSRLLAQLPSGYEMFKTNNDAIQVTVTAADAAKGTAALDVYVDGVAAIAATADVFSKDRFVGRSAQEVITLLSVQGAISSSSVTFTPFWLKRVPTLKDHIMIDIQEPAQ